MAESLQNKPAASEHLAVLRAMQLAKEEVAWVIEHCKSIQDAITQKADIDAHDMVAEDRKNRTGQAAHKIAAEVANWRQIRDIVIGLRQQAELKTKEHAEAYESALGGRARKSLPAPAHRTACVAECSARLDIGGSALIRSDHHCGTGGPQLATRRRRSWHLVHN